MLIMILLFLHSPLTRLAFCFSPTLHKVTHRPTSANRLMAAPVKSLPSPPPDLDFFTEHKCVTLPFAILSLSPACLHTQTHCGRPYQHCAAALLRLSANISMVISGVRVSIRLMLWSVCIGFVVANCGIEHESMP